MIERFAPCVRIDGINVQPEAWMWVLAFAIGGCKWAREQAQDPAFDLRGKIRDYYRRRAVYDAERKIAELEAQLKKQCALLVTLKGD